MKVLILVDIDWWKVVLKLFVLSDERFIYGSSIYVIVLFGLWIIFDGLFWLIIVWMFFVLIMLLMWILY